MKATSSKSMLLQILVPIFCVLAIWFTMSLTTTNYVKWVQRSNQRVFTENVLAVRAAESLQIAVWRLVAEFPTDVNLLSAFRDRWREAKARITAEHQTLASAVSMGEEKAPLAELEASIPEFLDVFSQFVEHQTEANAPVPEASKLMTERQRAIELATRIAKSAQEDFRVNQNAIDQYKDQRERYTNQILWGRFTIMLAGPLLGIFLGWRLAQRLDRSIARIAVTLHDAETNSNSRIGTLAIEGTSDFSEVQQKAEQVANRMRQVSLELQTARREVLQAERLAAVGELAAGVAHEIRNPLTSVKLLLQYAIRKASGPTLDGSQLQLILEEIGRMETTIQGLLDFARPPKLNRVPHDLRQTLQRALNLIESRARQQGIEITLHNIDSPLIVDGDTEKLHQVLVNLLINAIEAMPDGGRLSIETSDQTMKIDLPRTFQANTSDPTHHGNGDHVAIITIRDTGEGIDNSVLSRLFEPFATTKERGTGLGLAVSHRIVEEHRGILQACNDPNGGARFTLTIPLIESTDDESSTGWAIPAEVSAR